MTTIRVLYGNIISLKCIYILLVGRTSVQHPLREFSIFCFSFASIINFYERCMYVFIILLKVHSSIFYKTKRKEIWLHKLPWAKLSEFFILSRIYTPYIVDVLHTFFSFVKLFISFSLEKKNLMRPPRIVLPSSLLHFFLVFHFLTNVCFIRVVHNINVSRMRTRFE